MPDQHLRVGRRVARQLAHEPRLADPGLADEGHELHAPGPAHARQGGVERGELALAAGQRRRVGAPGADRVEQRPHRLAQAQLPDPGLARQPRRRADDLARTAARRARVTSAVPPPRRGGRPGARASAASSPSRRWSAVAARTARTHRPRGSRRAEDRHEPVGSRSTTGSPWRRRTVTAASSLQQRITSSSTSGSNGSPPPPTRTSAAMQTTSRRAGSAGSSCAAVEQREPAPARAPARGPRPARAARRARRPQRLGPATAELQRVHQLHPDDSRKGCSATSAASSPSTPSCRPSARSASMRAPRQASRSSSRRATSARRTTRSASRARPDLATAPSPRAARRRRRRGRRGPARPRPPPQAREPICVTASGRRAAARSRPPATRPRRRRRPSATATRRPAARWPDWPGAARPTARRWRCPRRPARRGARAADRAAAAAGHPRRRPGRRAPSASTGPRIRNCTSLPREPAPPRASIVGEWHRGDSPPACQRQLCRAQRCKGAGIRPALRLRGPQRREALAREREPADPLEVLAERRIVEWTPPAARPAPRR